MGRIMPHRGWRAYRTGTGVKSMQAARRICVAIDQPSATPGRRSERRGRPRRPKPASQLRDQPDRNGLAALLGLGDLHGDPLALDIHLTLSGRRTPRPSPGQLFLELDSVRHSFWGVFGWFNVPVPPWMFAVYDALSLAALAGLVVGVWRLVRGARTETQRRRGAKEE